jgi:8-oxo-dGTP diphosphatase
MTIGRFIAGVAALIWSPKTEKYLLLRRSDRKDYARGSWECVTGRVDQGEGFEEALYREVLEELGVEVKVDHILGTTHFHRGDPIPENELVGVIYLCSLDEPNSIHIGEEHSAYRWLTAEQAIQLLITDDPTMQWAKRIIQRAEVIRPMLPKALVEFQNNSGFELG